ncbi:MAG: hypothetical protein NW215_04675 [Hyphomicrobiales bacterium]|nr:hypothetical protein [Hyphomicrobiales bacterium]
MSKTVVGIMVGVVSTVAGGLLLTWLQKPSEPDIIPQAMQGKWSCGGEAVEMTKNTIILPNQVWKVTSTVTVPHNGTDNKQATSLMLENGLGFVFGVVDGTLTFKPAEKSAIPNMPGLSAAFAAENARNARPCYPR